MTTINDKCVLESTVCDLDQADNTPGQILFDLNAIICDGFQNNYGVAYTAELVFDFAEQHKDVLVGKEFTDLASAKAFVQKAFKGLSQKQGEQPELVKDPVEFFKTGLSVIACLVAVAAVPATSGAATPATVVACSSAALNVYDYVND